MVIKINKKVYNINEGEFQEDKIEEFCNLRILNNVGLFERLISFFIEFKKCDINNLLFFNTNHGGFLPIECSSFFEKIILINTKQEHEKNIIDNIELHKVQNIHIGNTETIETNNFILFSDSISDINFDLITNYKESILISKFDLNIINNNIFKYVFKLQNTDFFIYLNENKIHSFKETFRYYFDEKDNSILNYDNLIHLCIMVKNGGDQFEDMLKKNMHLIDRWTILDTGSTDNTIDTINKVLVGKKSGQLFQEPFINFRDSRNRCLDLAGNSCKYCLILDDTYIMEGNIRDFLNRVRGDQRSDSFSIIIKSDDIEYCSNRILKSTSGLRYMHKIHEVIQDFNNFNVIIPIDKAMILDMRFDYMNERTMKRKELDLQLLYEEVEDDPLNPRTYYYLAQTYNLLEKYELAFKFFLKRAEFTNSGFIQERIDSLFEAARIANFKINKPWDECLQLYERAFKLDESRPDSQYFIGIHFYTNNDFTTAYKYFKKAFEIGYPLHAQYSLKPTLSFYFLPYFLTKVCYDKEDYKLGQEAAELFLAKNPPHSENYEEIVSWHKIYKLLNVCPKKLAPVIPKKPIVCFIADGGFEPWSGETILKKGVGGSETYIIEMARYIQKSGNVNVVVFCNCVKEEVFEEVLYKPLKFVFSYIYSNYIHTCIVSRFIEYLPAVFGGWTENVYLVLHDLIPTLSIIHKNHKLKKIFCLSEWHVDYFNNIFPSLKELSFPFYYGIDFSNFKKDVEKIPHKFIYSSFPNRGLLPLLQMWPNIYEKQPLATLHIYSDIDGKWVNDFFPEEMKTIKRILEKYNQEENKLGIHSHGWVDKKTLADSWASADIWFYPCTFMETFCLTALESALTKTLVITNDLAALQNTVSDRGIVIKGNAMETEWQEKALERIFYYMDNSNKNEKTAFIEKNYNWALTLSWESQAQRFLNQHILQEKLEYKEMYNWTNNIPNVKEKGEFLKTIDYFNNCYVSKVNKNPKILEIGTYTGISLINIVKLIPNSQGFGIDKWTNYNTSTYGEKIHMQHIESFEIEKSFYKNIEIENLTNRIFGMKGDSKVILFEMIKKNDIFDFIYIDGSHQCLDCYLDIFLAWKLLNKGGILAIDDYTFNKNDKMQSPFEAVNKFLNMYKGQYHLLYTGYRVFLEKTIA